MDIIKCHICKLNKETCNYKCVELEDVSILYREGMSEKDAIPKGYCTKHLCEYNIGGFKCSLNKCIMQT